MTWPGLRPLTTTPTTTLDLTEGVGQRSASYTFQLVDAVSGELLGYVHPIRDDATLTHDTGRTIKRDLRVQLAVSDTAAVNPLTDRLIPTMTIAGITYPLGRYMFTDQTLAVSTGGDRSGNVLLDEMHLVDQQISEGFAPVLGGTVQSTVLDLLAGLPLVGIDVEPSPYQAVGAWPPGTTRGQILDALATQGDYMTPWLDHHGVFRMVRTVDPDTAAASIDLDAAGVIRDTIQASSDLLSAPNRFVVVGNGSDALAAPIVGIYDVPPSAPYSIAQRGFAIPTTINMQVATIGQATAAARNLGIRASVFRHTDLDTPPDPRHDGYDVLVWQGVNWLELAWSMTLREGANMSHTLRRSFM